MEVGGLEMMVGLSAGGELGIRMRIGLYISIRLSRSLIIFLLSFHPSLCLSRSY
jgi:hypothetical protein